MRFANPFGFIFLFIPIVLVILRRRKLLSRRPAIGAPMLYHMSFPLKSRSEFFLFSLKLLLLVILAFALMRPQMGQGRSVIRGKVVDIMLVLDISGSMQAMDMGKQTRIAVAKAQAKRFVDARTSDRIGLILFAAKTFLQCPLTVDKEMLKSLIDMAEVGMIQDGTAIGSALAVAIKHMKDSKARSKVIVLITDGVNNAGKIDPITAAKMAKKLGIKVYTIGVGKTSGPVPFLINDPLLGKRIVMGQTELDEELLKKIAIITGGRYFRVFDEAGMREVFEEIDRLEKTDVRIERFFVYKELFPYLLAIGLGLVGMIVLLEDLVFLTVP